MNQIQSYALICALFFAILGIIYITSAITAARYDVNRKLDAIRDEERIKRDEHITGVIR